MDVKRAYAETGFDGRMVILWARRAEMGACFQIVLVHGPAVRMTVSAAMVCSSLVFGFVCDGLDGAVLLVDVGG
jgi:hypothetical protein